MRKWSKAIAFMMTAALAVGSFSVGPVVQKLMQQTESEPI